MAKRKRTSRMKFRMTTSEKNHLLRGDCGQQSGCALCWLHKDKRILNTDLAEKVWNVHRETLLKQWREPFPSFGEFWFDDAELTDLDDDEPIETWQRYNAMVSNAFELQRFCGMGPEA